jgi:hypothetical protein
MPHDPTTSVKMAAPTDIQNEKTIEINQTGYGLRFAK